MTEIRVRPGLSPLVGPDTYPTDEDLAAAAAHDPVVTVNTDKWRSRALALTRHALEVIRLPELGQAVMIERINEFRWALTASTDPIPDYRNEQRHSAN